MKGIFLINDVCLVIRSLHLGIVSNSKQNNSRNLTPLTVELTIRFNVLSTIENDSPTKYESWYL